MPLGSRILVIEDDAKVIVFLKDILQHMGHQVEEARDGVAGLRLAKEIQPHLIILDVMMPNMDGYEVCRHLKADAQTHKIPILMLTARGQRQDIVEGFNKGADDYLAKPYDKAIFEARVTALLRRSTLPPFPKVQNECIVTISCRRDQKINIRVSGIINSTNVSQAALNIDIESHSRHAEIAAGAEWRFKSKQIGKDLFRRIFLEHPEVLNNYSQALGKTAEDEKFSLHFESPSDFLRVPLEFLFDAVNERGDYLALHHPVIRSVTGVQIRKGAVSPKFINELWENGDKLKILLIASNTVPPIPGVDQEIAVLSESIKRTFEERRILVDLDVLTTEKATLQAVKMLLKSSKYHIIHYAGHGSYDETSPEKSALYFWEKEEKGGDVEALSVYELQMLLRGSKIRFFYLSCCLGAKTGGPTKLLEDDFLGVADGIVQAGIPSVLGFRWEVKDSGAKKLALAFYDSLARNGHLDIALMDARREVAAQNADDITWLSPLLIMQI